MHVFLHLKSIRFSIFKYTFLKYLHSYLHSLILFETHFHSYFLLHSKKLKHTSLQSASAIPPNASAALSSTGPAPSANPAQNTFQNSSLTAVTVMDDLVREYLLFRGFNSCLRSLELDLKADKDKSLRADKVIEQIFSLIYSFDLSGLLDYWLYLDTKFFSRLTMKLNQTAGTSVSLTRKYELFLLRYYLIHAIQSGKEMGNCYKKKKKHYQLLLYPVFGIIN